MGVGGTGRKQKVRNDSGKQREKERESGLQMANDFQHRGISTYNHDSHTHEHNERHHYHLQPQRTVFPRNLQEAQGRQNNGCCYAQECPHQ